MPSNDFNKEEKVAFAKLLKGYEDALSLSMMVSMEKPDSTESERSSDITWYPQPYIMQSFDGADQTGNFQSATQLSVPTTLGYDKPVPWSLTSKQLRDASQRDRLTAAAMRKAASDINVAVTNVISQQSTLVVPVTGAAGQYDDIALCDSLMTEQGVSHYDRYMGLSPRDYNGMANELQVNTRSLGNKISDDALRLGVIPDIANFNVTKMQYANYKAAALGSSLTMDTQASASNYWVPEATRVATTGERSNVDNRYQTVTISATTNVVAGDCFTIAGVQALHHETKDSTGQLKTFRVISVDSGTTMTISPPIISNQGLSDAEAQYQNVEVTASATAALVFLNNAATYLNPFWCKDAVQIRGGRIGIDKNAGAGIMTNTTKQGLELVMQKQYNINTREYDYRIDSIFGVTMLQPEMCGVLLFNQT